MTSKTSQAHQSREATRKTLTDYGYHPSARNSDSLDFHDIHISTLKQMLVDAFKAGQEAR